VQSKRIYQLGLFLATAGASLLLSGAAHADGGDVTSPSQTNQSTANQQVVVSDQSTTTSSVKDTQQASGQATTSDSGAQPAASSAPTAQTQTPSSNSPVASSAPSAPTGAQPASQPSSAPAILPVTFFQPVTIITPLIPTVIQTGGEVTVNVPTILPAKPTVPAPPPTGALNNVTQALGQSTLPTGGIWTFFTAAHQGWPVSYLSLGLITAIMAISFASLLRRWGYAISARGSDSRLQLAYEFASPAMSELVPVRTMYPG
jgi:cytoskeletal protein RodZ